MSQPISGAFRLFRFAGIDVFLHWSWFVVAFLEVQYRQNFYASRVFNVFEYLALFLIVLLHEFGHSLACRSVGGRADQIVLWPLGGIAYVAPPPRPGAVLWSIAAGPLVNVVLILPTFGLYFLGVFLGWQETAPDTSRLTFTVAVINVVLLIFNVLPVYPLDGGQILYALLWFVVGRTTALSIVSVIGILGAIAFGALAYYQQDIWFGVMAFFVLMRAIAGFQQSRAMARLLAGPRHEEAACPACGVSPLQGPFWVCDKCMARFDTFDYGATCPGCGKRFATTACLECQARNPIETWYPYGQMPVNRVGEE